ncbi:hypothetical protein PS15p_212131 [Mucor circinelloides]
MLKEILRSLKKSRSRCHRQVRHRRLIISLQEPKELLETTDKITNRHVDLHDEVSYPFSNTVVEDVSFVVNSPDIPQFKRNLRQLPNAEDNVVDFLEEVLRSSTIQDIADGEAMFKDILLHPFLKAVCVASVAGVPQFKVDETLLRAISKRANESEIDNDESTLYIADGIISLYDFNKVEVLLLETSGRFGSLNNSKSSFDHHKGLFGSLSMLKVTAEQTYTINTASNQRVEQVPFMIKVYLAIKCLIEETVKNLATLSQEHMKAVAENTLTTSLPKDNLSTLISCSMLKLAKEKDKTGMFCLGPFYAFQ